MARSRLRRIGASISGGAAAALLLMTIALPSAASAVDDPALGSISGSMTTSAGAALRGDVAAIDAQGGVHSVATDADGDYSIPSLLPGSYTVRFLPSQQLSPAAPYGWNQPYWPGVQVREQATAVSVTAGATTPGISAAIAPSGLVRGTVTAPSPTSREFGVTFFLDGVDPLPLRNDLPSGVVTPGTPWAIAVPAGEWNVAFVSRVPGGQWELDQYFPNTVDPSRIISVDVTARTETEGINASVNPPGSAILEGDAFLAQQMSVRLDGWALGTTFAYQWLRDGTAIDGATSGGYLPGFADWGTRLSVRVTATAPSGAVSTVTSAESAAITSEDDASLQVSAVDPSGTAVPGANVYLFTEGGGIRTEGTTDAQGRVVFRGLPADANYEFTVFQTDDDPFGRLRLLVRHLHLEEKATTERTAVLTPGLPAGVTLEGSFTGSTGSVGVFTQPAVIALADQPEVESVELRLSLRVGDADNVQLIKDGDDFIGVVDLDVAPQFASAGLARVFPGGEEQVSVFDLTIAAPSLVLDQRGAPVAGAEVTLLHATSADGPFTPVAAEDLAGGTDRVPVTTDAQGRFGFVPFDPSGFFRVRVSTAGVTADGPVTTAPFAAGSLTITLNLPDRSTPTSGGSGTLASTGFDAPLPLASLLLLAGAITLVVARARRRGAAVRVDRTNV